MVRDKKNLIGYCRIDSLFSQREVVFDGSSSAAAVQRYAEFNKGHATVVRDYSPQLKFM
jgi:hypothetical protein